MSPSFLLRLVFILNVCLRTHHAHFDCQRTRIVFWIRFSTRNAMHHHHHICGLRSWLTAELGSAVSARSSAQSVSMISIVFCVCCGVFPYKQINFPWAIVNYTNKSTNITAQSTKCAAHCLWFLGLCGPVDVSTTKAKAKATARENAIDQRPTTQRSALHRLSFPNESE